VTGDRKKSWREIDRARESGSRGVSRDPDAARRARASETSAYAAYKSQLDELFTPGGAELPESLREKLGPPSESSQSRRRRLAALAAEPSATTLAAVREAGDPLPEDPRLLMRLMDVRDPEPLVAVLERLAERLDAGAKVNRMLLRQRLDATAAAIEDEAVAEALERVRAIAERG